MTSVKQKSDVRLANAVIKSGENTKKDVLLDLVFESMFYIFEKRQKGGLAQKIQKGDS